MKNNQKKKTLTFGDLIAAVYHLGGKRRALGLVQLAVNAHVIAFQGRRYGIIS